MRLRFRDCYLGSSHSGKHLHMRNACICTPVYIAHSPDVIRLVAFYLCLSAV